MFYLTFDTMTACFTSSLRVLIKKKTLLEFQHTHLMKLAKTHLAKQKGTHGSSSHKLNRPKIGNDTFSATFSKLYVQTVS